MRAGGALVPRKKREQKAKDNDNVVNLAEYRASKRMKMQSAVVRKRAALRAA